MTAFDVCHHLLKRRLAHGKQPGSFLMRKTAYSPDAALHQGFCETGLRQVRMLIGRASLRRCGVIRRRPERMHSRSVARRDRYPPASSWTA